MENPARTAQHYALIDKRRNDLRNFCSQNLASISKIVWEIGSGHGHYLTAFAEAHPDKACIGVDIEASRIERACRKRDRAQLTNLHFVHGDARLFLEVLPPSTRLDLVLVLFPDPWPKLRHHKHRIMQPEFLDQVAARAGEGCRLCFRTDFEPYYQDTLSVLRAHANWEVVDESWPFERETVFQSRAASHYSIVARIRLSPG